MTAVFSHPSAPSENWDDDFEFRQSTDSPRTPMATSSTRASATSSHPNEDWDNPSPVVGTHTQFVSQEMKRWPDSKSSTPAKRPFLSTENWDDDFEDAADSPSRKTASRIEKAKSRSDQPHTLQEVENWDDEFELPSTSPPRVRRHHNDYNQNGTYHSTLIDDGDDDDDDNDNDFGFTDREEDKTVTARSRRAALSRLSTPSESSPPPPVPPIPFSLLTPATTLPDQPFPGSPTTSVFSAPSLGSGRDSMAYSYYPNSSTTQLRPTMSRSSIGGFANLPPSPPIHKERERRRLRKKSRPHPEALYELAVRTTSQDESQALPSSDDDNMLMRAVTPQTPPHSSSNEMLQTPNSRASVNLSSPPNKTPLLSRIGSVKKWGVRKKRASSAPSDVVLQEMENVRDPNEHTPRPPGSMIASSPTKTGNWFFRTSTNGAPPPQMNAEASTSSSDLNHEDSPTKLIKKKSFGFVPIRRNRGPLNDGSQSVDPDLPSDLELELGMGTPSNTPRKKKRHLSQQISRPSGAPIQSQPRHASHTGTKQNREDVDEGYISRERQKSFSRSRSRDGQDQENHRFARTISLVGHHKRTKSTASNNQAKMRLSRKSQDDAMPVDIASDLMTEISSSNGIKTPARDHSPSRAPSIELQPPSPPRPVTRAHIADESAMGLDVTLLPPGTSSSILQLRRTPSPTKQAPSSLGRSSTPVNIASVPRRNSLGDLKIPARISQAQVGIRRDLSLVKEFASQIEQLKDLQVTYHSIVLEVQSVLDRHAHSQAPSRAVSPTFFNLPRPKSRSRSSTASTVQPPVPPSYKQFASTFYTINSKYRIAWECASLLIELGNGSGTNTGSQPVTSVSAPVIIGPDGKWSRERAITLNSDDPKSTVSPVASSIPISVHSPPLASPPLGWRASTGRHDLNQRQLTLLRELLNNPDPSQVSEDSHMESEPGQSVISVNRQWRWGDAMNSTVTLPSEEDAEIDKPRKGSRLRSLRDMLRSLKKNSGSSSSSPRIPPSTASLSTDSSMDSSGHARVEFKTQGRRRAKTSTGPESMSSLKSTSSPYMTSMSHNTSPRRPSLASIFRIGQKSKGNSSDSRRDGANLTTSVSRVSNSTGEDEDWDHLDGAEFSSPASVRDHSATIRGLSPYSSDIPLPSSGRPSTPKQSTNGSQTSLWAETGRPTRLSNVEEHADDGPSRKPQMASPVLHQSRSYRGGKTGSVRSMPPQAGSLPDTKLAMTPENIKPLLENAKEVHTRLTECITEIRTLLTDHQR